MCRPRGRLAQYWKVAVHRHLPLDSASLMIYLMLNYHMGKTRNMLHADFWTRCLVILDFVESIRPTWSSGQSQLIGWVQGLSVGLGLNKWQLVYLRCSHISLVFQPFMAVKEVSYIGKISNNRSNNEGPVICHIIGKSTIQITVKQPMVCYLTWRLACS